MHGNNNQDRGQRLTPSEAYEEYSGPNKEIREKYRREMWEREGSKPNTQMSSSSATGASSSRSKK